uniref:DUF6585 family protein n=1 Tax=Nocardia alni TaxID=2815723 RepID=UPI001C230204
GGHYLDMGSAACEVLGELEAVRVVALREGLGEYRSTYRPRVIDARWPIVDGGLTGAAVVTTVGGFVGDMVEVGVLGATVAVVSGARLLADLGWLRFAGTRQRGIRLDLYERGCVISEQRRVRVVRYDSTIVRRKIVHAVQNPAAHQISYRYTLVDTAGTPVVLDRRLERPQEWGVAIEQGILDAQVPQAQARMDAGGRLEFEPLWLSASEIGTATESVPWSRISELAVVGGWLSVRVSGRAEPLESLPLCVIPNYVVFRALAQRLHALAVH